MRRNILTVLVLFAAALFGVAAAAQAPSLQVTPGSVEMGSLPLGVASEEKSVRLSNPRDTVLRQLQITTDGDFSQANDCGDLLPAGASCTVRLTFTPTSVGSREGTLTISYDGMESPLLVQLHGQGLEAPSSAVGTIAMFQPEARKSSRQLQLPSQVKPPATTPTFTTAKLKAQRARRPTRASLARTQGAVAEQLLPPPPPPPTPRFGYATNIQDNTLSIFTVNAATGRLRASGYVQTGTNPLGVSLDPSSSFAYVSNFSSNSISGYQVNAATGALTEMPGSPFAAGLGPFAAPTDAAGEFLYVSNSGDNTISAYSIDQVTGALAPIAGSPFATGSVPGSIGVDPLGEFLYVANFADNTI